MEVDLSGFVAEVGRDAEQVRNSEHGQFFLSPYLGVFVLLVNKRYYDLFNKMKIV